MDKLGVNGGRVIPAGVIYVKAAINDTRVELPDDTLAEEKVKSMQKREGMVLDDEDIISAMGAEYTPVYNAKKPNVIPEAKRKFLFTEESLNGIINDSLTVTANIADQIAKGNVKAIPRLHDGKKTFCDSCEYKPICRKAVIT